MEHLLLIIFLDYTLQTTAARERQAGSLQMDDNCLGWTVLLMNRGPRAINEPLVGYHWIVCLFSPEGQCFFGDPLNSVKIPANLPETLNPYYEARFGKKLDYIFNCSVEDKFPNFPRQLSDAHCCGFVCLLVMILAKQPKYIEFILSANKIVRGPRFLKFPGYYPEFLRQLFQALSAEEEIRLGFVLAKQEVSNLIKQAGLWARTPFVREKALKGSEPLISNLAAEESQNNEGKEQQSQFKKVMNKKKSFKSFVVADSCENNNPGPGDGKLKKKRKLRKTLTETDDLRESEKTGIEEMDDAVKEDKNRERMDHYDVDESKSTEDKEKERVEEYPTLGDMDNETGATEKDKVVFEGKIVGEDCEEISNESYDGSFVGKLTFLGDSNINDHDSYAWTLKGRRKKNKIRQLFQYSCKIEGCNANKTVKKVGTFPKQEGKLEWDVDYQTPHTCEVKSMQLRFLKDEAKKEASIDPVPIGNENDGERTCEEGSSSGRKIEDNREGGKVEDEGQKKPKERTLVSGEATVTPENCVCIDDEIQEKPGKRATSNVDTVLKATAYPTNAGDMVDGDESQDISDKRTLANGDVVVEATDDPIPAGDVVREDEIYQTLFEAVVIVGKASAEGDESQVKVQQRTVGNVDLAEATVDHTPAGDTVEDIESPGKSSQNTEGATTNPAHDVDSVEDEESPENSIEKIVETEDVTGKYIGDTIEENVTSNLHDTNEDLYEEDSDEAASKVKEGITIEFPVGNSIRSYRLIQLSKQPKCDNKGIAVENDVAVIICNSEGDFIQRGHFDCYPWGKMLKGKGKKVHIGSYNCTQKSNGCPAAKRKWICSGRCEFDHNFCCNYSIPGFDSLVSLYSNTHTHQPKNTNVVSIDEIFADDNSDDEIDSTLEPPVSSTPKRGHVINVSTSEELELRLKSSFSQPELACYNSSCIRVTSISKINSKDMNDTFHILPKSPDVRAFDACKDGFEYKRMNTKQIFPALFPNQQVHKYECYGRLKCVNDNCPIFRRLSALSYSTNKTNASKQCSHCSEKMIEDHCSGIKFTLHSQGSNFVVVYYSKSHSCGDQDWVVDPNVIEQLTAIFETNDGATSAVAYKKLFEEKLRVALNEKSKESQSSHIQDLIAVVNNCARDHVVKNIKSKVIKTKTPLGRGIEAVKVLKDSSSLIYDKLGIIIKVVVDSYVCASCKQISFSTEDDEEIGTECCSYAMVNTGPVILVTSRDNLQSGIELSTQDGLFSASTVHVDHQPARCKTMDTLNVAFYDHNLREMSSVFMTHSMGENQYNVFFEFKLFEVVLKEHFGSDAKFDPFGFTSDNAGGITAGIKLCFGPLKPHRTCRFHIIYCGYQHCGTSIGSKGDQILFLRFLFSLIDASTATLFVEIAEKFWKWIRELPSRKKQLENWWDFWFNCRAMWSSAFTNQTLTEVSLVESLQSKYSKKNNLKKLPLYQSVVFSMSDLTKYSARLKELGKGKYIGQGPSKAILDERDMMKQVEKVKFIPLSNEDFKYIFTNFGLPYKIDREKCPANTESAVPPQFESPISREKSQRHEVLEKFSPSPIASHTFKKPALPNSSEKAKKAKKPGRPPKSKSKTYVSRFSRELDLDLELLGEEDFDPTVLMDENFVSAGISLPDEIVFTEHAGEKINLDSENDLELLEEEDFDPTLPMDENFVSAGISLPDEIVFTENPSEKSNLSSKNNPSSFQPSKRIKKREKSKINLSSVFSEDESLVEPQLMERIGNAENETGRIAPSFEGRNTETSDFDLEFDWDKNDSEEDWLDSIDWDETDFSQNTLDRLLVHEQDGGEDGGEYVDEVDDGTVPATKGLNYGPRKKARSKDSVHYKKQKLKAIEEQDSYIIVKLSEDSFQLKKNTSNNPLQKPDVKIVNFNFDEKEVTCTCEAWKTEKNYKTKGDEVCKQEQY